MGFQEFDLILQGLGVTSVHCGQRSLPARTVTVASCPWGGSARLRPLWLQQQPRLTSSSATQPCRQPVHVRPAEAPGVPPPPHQCAYSTALGADKGGAFAVGTECLMLDGIPGTKIGAHEVSVGAVSPWDSCQIPGEGGDRGEVRICTPHATLGTARGPSEARAWCAPGGLNGGVASPRLTPAGKGKHLVLPLTLAAQLQLLPSSFARAGARTPPCPPALSGVLAPAGGGWAPGLTRTGLGFSARESFLWKPRGGGQEGEGLPSEHCRSAGGR